MKLLAKILAVVAVLCVAGLMWIVLYAIDKATETKFANQTAKAREAAAAKRQQPEPAPEDKPNEQPQPEPTQQ